MYPIVIIRINIYIDLYRRGRYSKRQRGDTNEKDFINNRLDGLIMRG